MPNLVHIVGPDRGQGIPLRKGTSILGRAPDCDVVISDRRASRKHTSIILRGGVYYVQDMGSRNGTLVNGKRISGTQRLNDGDRIQVCDVQVVFKAEAARPPQAAGPPVAVAPPAEQAAKPEGRVSKLGMSMINIRTDPETDEQSSVNLSIDADVDRLETVAPRSQEALQRSHERLRIMMKVANTLGTIHELDGLLEEVMKQIFSIFPQADRGFVMLCRNSEDPEDLEPKVIRKRGADPDEEVEISISRSLVREVVSKRKAILSTDTADDDRFQAQMSILNFKIRSMMSVPLIWQGELLGLIDVDTTSQSERFSQPDLELLTSIAPQVAMAIKNTSLVEQIADETRRRSDLQRYLSPNFVEQIMQGTMDLSLGGKVVNGTVFFSDIVGYTSISSMMKPSQVVDALNSYFHVMEEIIFRYNGTIDKFGGDSIMAWWGVLLEQKDSTLQAVCAGVEMQNALFDFNHRAGALIARPFHLGIGLNTGELVAGNIGSAQKIEFTVIGDSVNVTQRIESLAGEGQVFVGQSTYTEVAPRAAAIKLPPMEVKGKAGPIDVYCIRAIQLPGAGASDGLLCTLPVELVAGGARLEAIATGVKHISEKECELSVLTDRSLRVDVELQVKPVLRLLPGLPSFPSRVTEVEPPEEGDVTFGSKLRVTSLPPEVRALLVPGGLAQASVTTDQIVRT